MQAKIENVPSTWPAGRTRDIPVSVTAGKPGAECKVTLFRTVPGPDVTLGHVKTNFTPAGEAVAVFTVMLDVKGVNVLHCEVVVTGDFDSNSKATEVT